MDSFKHNVPTSGAGQKTFEQCWLASYKTLFKFHKRNPGEIEDKLKAVNIDVEDAKEKGLFDTDYRKAADALNLTRWSARHSKKWAGLISDSTTEPKRFSKN